MSEYEETIAFDPETVNTDVKFLEFTSDLEEICPPSPEFQLADYVANDSLKRPNPESSDGSSVQPKKRLASPIPSSSELQPLNADNVFEESDGDGSSVQPKERPGNSQIVASHYNTLEEKGLAERSKSRIFYMRNFNNWIKSVLINEYITSIRDSSKLGEPIRVLDMCCGKGGDLNKWEKARISHLICTDIAEVSIEQCESRYKSLAERQNKGGGGRHHNQFPSKFFSAEFFACDSTRARLREQYKDPSIDLNLVSCQFAFHYCFESLKQAECMIKNAAECLKTGGFFIGTMPNAKEIMRRQRKANSQTFGNGVYEISFLCDTECPPLFGGKYNFQLDGVVNCPEFLVHFPLLLKLARKYGLELVMKESFDDYFNRMVDSCKVIDISTVSN